MQGHYQTPDCLLHGAERGERAAGGRLPLLTLLSVSAVDLFVTVAGGGGRGSSNNPDADTSRKTSWYNPVLQLLPGLVPAFKEEEIVARAKAGLLPQTSQNPKRSHPGGVALVRMAAVPYDTCITQHSCYYLPLTELHRNTRTGPASPVLAILVCPSGALPAAQEERGRSLSL